jgi:biotin-(acetyl-CoA carboxylase) ligase
VESRRGQQGEQRLVVGIGINCHGDPTQAPTALQAIVTTVEQETGAAVETQSLLQAVLRGMQDWVSRREGGERAALLDAWRERARLTGRRVRVLGLEPPQTGTVDGLTAEGFLDITLDAGEPHVHHSGELQWLD